MKKLAPTGPILDPMSGYGVLTDTCRQLGISTCSIELNPPSYLWQVLLAPERKDGLMRAVYALEKSCHNITCTKDFESSDSWFPKESEKILFQLWEKSLRNLEKIFNKETGEDLLSAVLLPFLGRLSSHSAGTINIQVKRGGLVFYTNWDTDLKKYLTYLNGFLSEYIIPKSEHQILFGNTLNSNITDKKFSYIITSPPYPNMRDYYAFFFPENYALEKIFHIERFENINIRDNIIGSAIVSKFKANNIINFDIIYSENAKKFLNSLKDWKGNKRSMDDNMSYYIPYYYSYLYQLEQAYKNIESMLTEKMDGYIIVVNNTARKFTIPVDKFIKEIWTNFGCTAVEDSDLTTERAHVGSINPRAVGFKARHTEYAIRISRNDG